MTLQQGILLGLQVSIILTVFAVGLRATIAEATWLARQPGLLSRSFLAMFIVLPVVAVVLVMLFPLLRPIEIVLVALALSPVPPLLPMKIGKAEGDENHMLGLLIIVSLLAIAIVPFGLKVASVIAGRPMSMSPFAVAAVMFKMTLLPLAAGILVRHFARDFARRMAKPVTIVAMIVLAVGALLLLFGAWEAVWKLVGNGSILAIAAFVAAGLVAGHLLGGPNEDDRTVLALATATRHPALALAIAKAGFPNEPGLGATVLLYLLVGGLVAVPYIQWRKKLAARK
jgi:BASS family bile acid:Na+ symporter